MNADTDTKFSPLAILSELSATTPKFSDGMRRLHLDFHNPAGLSGFCEGFDPTVFARTLSEAGFDSATVFARDSHGHCYFPSETGVRHPDLKIDLLKSMIEGCHARGITVAAYISSGCCDYSPDKWCQVTKTGELKSYVDQGGYRMICPNAPYTEERILPLTEELLARYEMDAIWYDMMFFADEGCHCPYCLEFMKKNRLDPRSEADCRESMRLSRGVFIEKTSDLARKLRPRTEMLYNGISVDESPLMLDRTSYIELESLASAGWGYFYFPAKARYLRTLGKPVAGMTAAFHGGWGDFGSLKSQALLEFECHTFVAAGARVEIGDQMPPHGALEPARYDLIGRVLNPIRDVEPWLRDVVPMVEAAIVLYPGAQGQFPGKAWQGACKLLMEMKVQFDTVDESSDWTKYRILVLADHSGQSSSMRRKLEEYLAAGGQILATGDAIFDLPDENIAVAGSDYSLPAYYETRGDWALDIPQIPHVVKSGFLPLQNNGAEVLATLRPGRKHDSPFFYFSSIQAAYDGPTDEPVVVQSGSVIYIAARIFTEYHESGYGGFRLLLQNLISRILPDQLIKGNLPLAYEVGLLEKSGGMAVCSIVPFHAGRSDGTPQVEENLTVAGLTLKLRGSYSSAELPDGRPLELHDEDGYTAVPLPAFSGPQIFLLN